jgi:hypothetical protein
MEKLKSKSKAKVDAITDSCEELKDSERAWLIFNLLRQQKRLSTYKPCTKENCTLIDIRKGLIVGSNICPKCFGYIGRADGYHDLD